LSRILITGAGGFVGRHAMAAFAGRAGPGDALAGIGRALAAGRHDGVELRPVDLLDGPAVTEVVAAFRPTHVLHLAALSSVQQSAGAGGETWRSNVLGLLNLAEAVVAGAPGSTFVFASSGEVYGRAFLDGGPVTEAVRPWPANTYARTKLAGEDLLGDILPAAGVKLIVLRPFNHVGPGQDERFIGAYVAVVEGSAALAERAVFNVASGLARPISDILDTFKAQARVPFEIRVAQDRLRPSEIPSASGDASALAKAVGWQPRVPWDLSLAAILDDARSRLPQTKGQE